MAVSLFFVPNPYVIPCRYFGSVCELDIIFNFEKAYFILDELMIGGEVQETSKKSILKAIAAQDMIQEVSSELSVFLPLLTFSILSLLSVFLFLILSS